MFSSGAPASARKERIMCPTCILNGILFLISIIALLFGGLPFLPGA